MNESIFAPHELDRIIADTLPADATPGEKVLVGTVDASGAQVIASFQFADGWQLQGQLRKTWSETGVSGSARVVKRWK
jgi:hypothetical protein